MPVNEFRQAFSLNLNVFIVIASFTHSVPVDKVDYSSCSTVELVMGFGPVYSEVWTRHPLADTKNNQDY